MNHAVGLDIGGSHASAAVVNLDSRTVCEIDIARRDVDPDPPAEALLDAWAGAVSEAIERAGCPSIAHLGVAMPGPFDYAAGVSLLEHKFAALYGRNVGEGLRSRLAMPGGGTLPILFANDAIVYTLGEWWAGSGAGYERVIGLTLGTGLGAGFVVRGRIVLEDDPVARAELWCAPYRGGIAEDCVSARAIAAVFEYRTGSKVGAAEVAALATAGVEEAREAYRVFGKHLGTVLRPSIASLRPDCVVVGGNIARSWELFAEPMLAALGPGAPVVVPSKLFDVANLLGAAALGLVSRR